jgi:glutamyl/glutaminyl-tRNA synthetase
MLQVRSRIAPTPSGYLHKGNAFNFLLTEKLVKQYNGIMVLRIDDLDSNRIKPEYLADVFEVLHWLGITWQEGPQRPDQADAYSQHRRLNLYNTYIEQLKHGGHLFACECSRKQLEAFHQYPGTCRHKQLPFTDEVNWRLISPEKPVVFTDAGSKKTHEINLYEVMRHPVVRKRDGFPAYQVASLADDVHMNINLIVRGEDLLASTATQLYLAELLQLHSFKDAMFYHHPLLTGSNGEKLSKSAGSFSIKEYRKTHSLEALKKELDW